MATIMPAPVNNVPLTDMGTTLVAPGAMGTASGDITSASGQMLVCTCNIGIREYTMN